MIEQLFAFGTIFISMIIQVIIPPIPAELIVIGAGKLYGILITTIFAGTGLFVGSLLVYFIGKGIQKKFERFFNKEKVKTITKRLKHHEDWILWIRILPYNPSDIISYAAGIMHFNKQKFILITAITSYTRCFLLAFLGNYLTSVGTIIKVVALLILSSIIASTFLYKK